MGTFEPVAAFFRLLCCLDSVFVGEFRPLFGDAIFDHFFVSRRNSSLLARCFARVFLNFLFSSLNALRASLWSLRALS